MLERDRMRLPFVVFLLLLAGCSVPKGDQGPIGPTGKTGQDGLTDHQFRISFPSASAATSLHSTWLTTSINLSIRLRSAKQEVVVQMYSAVLLLYRK